MTVADAPAVRRITSPTTAPAMLSSNLTRNAMLKVRKGRATPHLRIHTAPQNRVRPNDHGNPKDRHRGRVYRPAE